MAGILERMEQSLSNIQKKLNVENDDEDEEKNRRIETELSNQLKQVNHTNKKLNQINEDDSDDESRQMEAGLLS